MGVNLRSANPARLLPSDWVPPSLSVVKEAADAPGGNEGAGQQ